MEFPLPDDDARLSLWRKAIPAAAPSAGDVDHAWLAQRFALTGGEIRNVALGAALLAAHEETPIGMSHLVRALGRNGPGRAGCRRPPSSASTCTWSGRREMGRTCCAECTRQDADPSRPPRPCPASEQPAPGAGAGNQQRPRLAASAQAFAGPVGALDDPAERRADGMAERALRNGPRTAAAGPGPPAARGSRGRRVA